MILTAVAASVIGGWLAASAALALVVGGGIRVADERADGMRRR